MSQIIVPENKRKHQPKVKGKITLWNLALIIGFAVITILIGWSISEVVSVKADIIVSIFTFLILCSFLMKVPKYNKLV